MITWDPEPATAGWSDQVAVERSETSLAVIHKLARRRSLITFGSTFASLPWRGWHLPVREQRNGFFRGSGRNGAGGVPFVAGGQDQKNDSATTPVGSKEER